MELEIVNELLEKQTGNRAFFYPILKDRLDVYHEQEVAFAGEFLFFEDKYLKIKKHMIENHIKQDIVDIGCQFGFQSELFLDSHSYIGIDRFKPSHFMNSEKSNIHYLVGLFPNTQIDLSEKTVISSMSLGYFDNMVDDDEEHARNRIVESLKTAETIYIATPESLVDKLSPYFNTVELMDKSRAGDFHLYFLSKKPKVTKQSQH